MKKLLSLLLSVLTVMSCMTFLAVGAAAEDGAEEDSEKVTYDLGTLTVVKLNGLWTEPSTNALAVFTPGQSMNGKYWTKLYARLDKATGDYVVEEKIGCHRDYPKVVENDCIGIMMNYAPLSTVGQSMAIANWKIIDRIKVGDRLTLSGIDVTFRSIKVSGTFGQADFKSEATIKVTAVRDKNPTKTAYTDKTIVAMGDSVTVGGGWTFDLGDAIGADIINSGFGGDTADASLAARYNTYVAAYNPDVVIVSFGINDAGSSYAYSDLEGAMDKYEKALRDIYARNLAIGARTVFQTPNNVKIQFWEERAPKGTYDEYGGFQGYLDTFIERMRVVARDTGSPLIDLYTAWKDAGYGGWDGVNMLDNSHPNEVGYDLNLSVMIPMWKENPELMLGEFDVAGDINVDGKCNSIDAVYALQCDAGFATAADRFLARADMNGDGVTDNLDAAAILKVDAGL